MRHRERWGWGRLATASVAGVALLVAAAPGASASGGFLGGLSTIKEIASTVPANGDLNPYGVAVVPHSVGALTRGDVLVSNFNNGPANQQGRGTTIVQVSPDGSQSLFASIDPMSEAGMACGGVGLTTALAVFREGFVVVGSLPTTDGMAATASAGCLFVINDWGKVVKTITGGMINGPWDLTAADFGDVATLFVTNVLNGTVAAGGSVINGGTVVRVDLSLRGDHPRVLDETTIGSGFPERTDAAALVIGPTGVGIGRHGDLFVADTLDNRIADIDNPFRRDSSAGTGETVAEATTTAPALNGPLGLVIAPNGDIITANAGDGNAVEVTPHGTQVDAVNVDDTGAGGGTLFGLALTPNGRGLYVVNDGNNMLDLMH